MSDEKDFLGWFRDSSPYIHSHRGCTFVVAFGGEALLSDHFSSLINDFALLNSLGIRLVLVHGIRPQIEERLLGYDGSSQYKDGLRITDDKALQCVKEAAGIVRVEIEARLSMGLPNSPMAGAKISVASGNMVTAKPLGVRGGTDFCHTGTVRRIDNDAIHQKLDQNNIVLLSPIGYSLTGEVFNLSAEAVATEAAIALGADKLLLLHEDSGIFNQEHQLYRQLTTAEASSLLENPNSLSPSSSNHLHAAVKACEAGVTRCHVLDRKIDGALLRELFTRDGVGTLISAEPFEKIRPATLDDIAGIIDLIRPLETEGILIERPHERLEAEINDYTVISRDGLIIGCSALHLFKEGKSGEIACVVLHHQYQGGSRGEQLLSYMEKLARSEKLESLFVLTTQSEHWFIEKGFKQATPVDLPTSRQASYDSQRKSKVLIKKLP
ncbi:MAG: amino-acid N-acetyltransferase [Gammaproteobacteria bacterium]|nr:MAG: amino-acid N-acetyltransferase [Gammaproteobacteria bacterium]RLA21694.1 MAG: amino-acid N-acetyltransferase [Gammaproteobacteria bacterium]